MDSLEKDRTLDNRRESRRDSRSKSKEKKPTATLLSCETCHLISSVNKGSKLNDMDEVMSEM